MLGGVIITTVIVLWTWFFFFYKIGSITRERNKTDLSLSVSLSGCLPPLTLSLSLSLSLCLLTSVSCQSLCILLLLWQCRKKFQWLLYYVTQTEIWCGYEVLICISHGLLDIQARLHNLPRVICGDVLLISFPVMKAIIIKSESCLISLYELIMAFFSIRHNKRNLWYKILKKRLKIDSL